MNTKKFDIRVLNSSKDKSIKQILIENRRIQDVEKFFNPDMMYLHDVGSVSGIFESAKLVLEHIRLGSKIFIHGDYDVDGICSTAILWSFLYRYHKANVVPIIPDRFVDGYGLSENTVQKMIDGGASLIITVDCGVKDVEIISKYSSKVDFIITDHHKMIQADLLDQYKESEVIKIGQNLIPSKAKAVVHPKLYNTDLEICGAFVAWDLCRAINELKPGVDMDQYLDLVALATVCDLMPIVGDNRIIVKKGLEQCRKTTNAGIRAICEVAKINLEEIDVYHLAFVIGPIINASGRIENAMVALRLLCTLDLVAAKSLAIKLNNLNKIRQGLTLKYFREAEMKLHQDQNKVKFVYGDDWPEGIVGLIASRIAEKYRCPAIVGSLKKGQVKASARSLEGIDILELIRRSSSYLIKFGGHALAAGLMIDEKKIEPFLDNVNKEFEKLNYKIDENQQILVDTELKLDDVDFKLFEDVSQFAPFGYGNPQPQFLVRNIPKPTEYQKMGENHFKTKLHYSTPLDILGFDLIEDLEMAGEVLDLVFTLEKNQKAEGKRLVLKLKALQTACN